MDRIMWHFRGCGKTLTGDRPVHLIVVVESLEPREFLSAAVHHTTKAAVEANSSVVGRSKVKHAAHPKKHHAKITRPTPKTTAHHTKSKFVLDNAVISAVTPATSPGLYTPALLRTAYGLGSVTFNGTPADGRGQTIAIVDAYNDPTIQSDLAAFNNLYGLPSTTLTVVNQSGGTTLPSNAPSFSWAVETALDVEWAHAVAPAAQILLVEASSDNDSDMYAAVDTARGYAGVSAVSMSWGEDEYAGIASNDAHLVTPAGHAGVTFLAATGDYGAYSNASTSADHPVAVSYPADSANVVAVGGTTLTTDSSGNYMAETGWGHGTSSWSSLGSGGGVSQFIAQPSYQSGKVVGSTSARTTPDVSMDADPNTGVPIIDSYDVGSNYPVEVGGTSLSAPLWAGLIALVNQGRVAAGQGTLDGQTQTLPAIYNLPASDFHDITAGSNGPYTAGAGYDLVTGRGSPVVSTLVPDFITLTMAPANASIVAFDAAATSANASDAAATLMVDRGGDLTQAATVQFATADGSATAGVDYVATAGTLSFAAGQSTATITVQLLHPTFTTIGSRSLAVSLSSPTGNIILGSQSSAAVNIAHSAVSAWLDPSSAASWDAASHTLTVTGATTLLADPGVDEPIIVASGSAARITIPASDTDLAYHLGGISLSNGAAFTLASLGTSRTSANHRVLVVGTTTPPNPPTFSIDSTSTLDLTDNDLILTHATGSTPFANVMSELQSASDGGRWDGAGLTSSAAALDATTYALGYAEASALNLSTFDGQSLGAGAVLVKYTLVGDTQLTGSVGLTDYTTVIRSFGKTGVTWIDGSFDYSGASGLSDYTGMIRNFGQSY